jgi:aryl-alcohol dehydrogenase-like predicted oxidoreductase
MQTRKLGNSDLHITPVGYGAWAIGGSGWQFGWGSQDDNDSIAAIHRSIELGVNWIDTAAVYGLGHSEKVVARALRSWPGPRDPTFLPRAAGGTELNRRRQPFQLPLQVGPSFVTPL